MPYLEEQSLIKKVRDFRVVNLPHPFPARARRLRQQHDDRVQNEAALAASIQRQAGCSRREALLVASRILDRDRSRQF